MSLHRIVTHIRSSRAQRVLEPGSALTYLICKSGHSGGSSRQNPLPARIMRSCRSAATGLPQLGGSPTHRTLIVLLSTDRPRSIPAVVSSRIKPGRDHDLGVANASSGSYAGDATGIDLHRLRVLWGSCGPRSGRCTRLENLFHLG